MNTSASWDVLVPERLWGGIFGFVLFSCHQKKTYLNFCYSRVQHIVTNMLSLAAEYMTETELKVGTCSLLLPLGNKSNFIAIVLIWKYWHHRYQSPPVASNRLEGIPFFTLFTMILVWTHMLTWLIKKPSYPMWNNQHTNSI